MFACLCGGVIETLVVGLASLLGLVGLLLDRWQTSRTLPRRASSQPLLKPRRDDDQTRHDSTAESRVSQS